MTMLDDTKIRERAYHIWETAGRPAGHAEEHWFQAMTEVAGAPSMVTPEPKTRARAKTATNSATKSAPAEAPPARKAAARKAPVKKAAPKK